MTNPSEIFMRLLKRHFIRISLSLIVLTFFILYANGTTRFTLAGFDFIRELELKFYDLRVKLTMPNTLDPRIIIVDIDEKSLTEIGHWPWNRKIVAKLVDKLFDTYQIDILGFDVVFAEADNSSGLKTLQELATSELKDIPEFSEVLTRLQPTLDYDALFVQSLRKRRVVLGYSFLKNNTAKGALPEVPPHLTAEALKDYHFNSEKAGGYVANLPQFYGAAAGHFKSTPDRDGVVRRVPMLFDYQGNLYESLSLAIVRLKLGIPNLELGLVNDGKGILTLDSLQLNQQVIPTDHLLRSLIPFRGGRGSFHYISATDVLHERLAHPEILKDKIVLLGTTAEGLVDFRPTPVDSVFPGVEVHANLISGILDNRILRNHPNYVVGVEVLLLILVGIIMISLVPLFSPLMATLGTIGLLGVLFWFNLAVWQQAAIVLPLASIMLLVLSLFLINMSYGYFVEARRKRQLTGLFGQYVPPELVDEMDKNLGKTISMAGESRKMTVLFSDVRGFTTISESLEPQDLSELMNAYLTQMTRIIHDHRGTIDKYMGDAIMAFWGAAPLSDPHHARHALDTALQMIRYLTEEIQPTFVARQWPPIQIGIGLNTGMMSVGNMGSEFRRAYTVMGDAVNLGSRLEGLTKQYGVSIIVGQAVRDEVPEYAYRELDAVRVKGKDQPVAIFEPLGLCEALSKAKCAELNLYTEALKQYRQQQWSAAFQQFSELTQRYPDCLLYQMYAQRTQHFLHHPPADNWDGVYTFTTK